MKIIKIIDLLNKIANGEEVPKKIIYDNMKWEWDYELCKYFSDNIHIDNYCDIFSCLNDEVEIIEEEKEIKKIKSNGYEFYSDINIWTKKEETVAYCECLMNKVNELIDVVNELKRGN